MTALHTLVDAMVRRLEVRGDPFERISAAPWIDAVEARYGTPLPDAYRYLLRNYRFPEFDLAACRTCSVRCVAWLNGWMQGAARGQWLFHWQASQRRRRRLDAQPKGRMGFWRAPSKNASREAWECSSARAPKALPAHSRCKSDRLLGGLSFYANLNSDSLEDVRVGPFVDPYMSPWLLARCFLPFARPDTGSYDPVCFDSSVHPQDPPIVRFDHEDILLERRKIKPVVLWPSFSELLAADP